MSSQKSKRPIQILNFTMQQVLRRTDETEAQRMIDSGEAYRASAREIVLYPPHGNRRTSKRLWPTAPSLVASQSVVQRAADGNITAQEIVTAYGQTSPRHKMELR